MGRSLEGLELSLLGPRTLRPPGGLFFPPEISIQFAMRPFSAGRLLLRRLTS